MSNDKSLILDVVVEAYPHAGKYVMKFTPDNLPVQDKNQHIVFEFGEKTPTGTKFISLHSIDPERQIEKVHVTDQKINIEDIDTCTVNIPYQILVQDPYGKQHLSDPQILNKPN